MDPPEPKLVKAATTALIRMGALEYTPNGRAPFRTMQLAPLGRLAIRVSDDLKVAKLILCGLVMKCSPDCIVMGAALLSERDDLFNCQPIYKNQR